MTRQPDTLPERIELSFVGVDAWQSVDDVARRLQAGRSSVDKALRRMWEAGLLFRRRDCASHGLVVRYAAARDYDDVKDLVVGARRDSAIEQLIAVTRRLLAEIEANRAFDGARP
ncbi:hypothetical protein ACQR1Y_12045 [Bradyrhizobium sp. HKCCYLRH3099]|uniref:hypothetical protein n=1 Tax=unclassified Bradyrhizobium TaxID=2631580 RepID=UPI003EB8F228